MSERNGIFLQPGEGRHYPMGRIAARFKADGDETTGAYSISEWWLEPHTKGPGAHDHPEDDAFFVKPCQRAAFRIGQVQCLGQFRSAQSGRDIGEKGIKAFACDGRQESHVFGAVRFRLHDGARLGIQ